MQLFNFSPIVDMSEPGWGRGLHALGVAWDLHSCAGFEGFDYCVSWTEGASFTLKWRTFEQSIPAHPSTRFCLVFTQVNCLEIGPRDPAMPMDEDATLDAIGCIEAGADSKEFRDLGWFPNHDPAADAAPFHLIFRFRGGQFIRIGAERAEFLVLDQ